MAMLNRLRRLERECGSSTDGLRSCKACANGTKHVTRFWFEGDPEPAPALCIACGRDITYRVNFFNAVPPTPKAPVGAESPA